MTNELTNVNETTIYKINEGQLKDSIEEVLKECFRKNAWTGWYKDILFNTHDNNIYISEFRSGGIIYDNKYIELTKIEQFYKEYDNEKEEINTEEENFNAFVDIDIDDCVREITEYIKEYINDNLELCKIEFID